MALELTFAFPLPNGLHARPACSLEEAVARFESEILLVNRRNGRTGNARSVLSLIGADCKFEDDCAFRISGQDEEEAFAALKSFLAEGLPRCDDAAPDCATRSICSPMPRMLRQADIRYVRGMPVSPGIGRGRVVMLSRFELPPALRSMPPLEKDREMTRFREGLGDVEENIDARLSTMDAGIPRQILRAHRAIVRDEAFIARVAEAIQERRCNAAAAVFQATQHFCEMLQSSESALLHARVLDIQDIGQQLVEAMYGEAARSPTTTLTEDSICVADTLTPSQFLALDRRFLRGLLLGESGSTSHAAILAWSFGIPILAGIDAREAGLAPGRDVLLDANLGILVTKPNATVERYHQQELRLERRRRRRMARSLEAQAVTSDGTRIGVAANVSAPSELNNPLFSGAEGVGLFRTEMAFLGRDAAPDEDEQFDLYRAALEMAGDRPVTFRTLDIGGDKPLPYLHLPPEPNPVLGCRAVRIYPEFLDIIMTQLRALVRAAAHGRLRVMIPMVSGLGEVRWMRNLMLEAREECRSRKRPVGNDIPVGVMLEVPSAAYLIDHLSKEADFFSIGTNDLVQYFMAADRENRRVSRLLSPFQPAFARFLKTIVDAIHANGKTAAICGEMAGATAALPLLVGLGVDELSVALPRIVEIKNALRRLDAGACRAVADDVLRCDCLDEATAALERFRERRADICLIERDLIATEADCRSPEEAVHDIVGTLCDTGRTSQPAKLEEDIWRREEVYSTALGHGFAIPHCKSAAIATNSIALLKLKEPIAWNASDGQDVDIVILLAMREADADNTHMKVFARLARNVMHDGFRESLRQENDPERLLAIIKNVIESE